MPTIAEVCERFDVNGVQTVRDGYAPLFDEGLVERLDSPRRWTVLDHGRPAPAAPDVTPFLDELEAALTRSLQLVRNLRAGVAVGSA